MASSLTRYWFECSEGLGIGVTAFNISDAIQLIASEHALHKLKPRLDSFTTNIKISHLDQNHVVPNMGICSNRGIWYPNMGATLR